MTGERLKAARISAGRFNRLLDIPEKAPLWLWAERHRMLPSDVTAKPGPYDVSVTPWMKEPQDSIDDPDVQVSAWCLASRLGKTEGLLNLMGRTVHHDPKHILLLYPTLDSCKKWSKEFFQPMVEASSCFRGLISDPRKRDGDNTTLSKRFPGGRISAIGANSPSGFRQVQAPIIIADEIDAMEASKEGDPITLAMKRADNYPDSIQVLASTTTIKGLSRIWSWLEASDFRKYFVQSPYSDLWHVLDWANLIWPEKEPQNAQYIDPDTGDPWTEEQRRDAVMAGQWRATQEFTGIRGYWCDGMVSLFAPKKGYKSKYHQWAQDFLDAKSKGYETLQVWHNTFRSLPWEEEAESLDWEVVKEHRAEDYEPTPLPDRVLMVTFAADVQADRIEFEWAGWGEDFESWGLGYNVFSGDTKRPEVWERLDKEIRRAWNHPSLKPIRLARGFIDEGYRPEGTRKFCLKLLSQGIEVYPCQGIGRTGAIEPEIVTYKPNKKQKGIKAPTFNVGTSRAKRTIYNHLLAAPPGPNTMHFPEGFGYDDRFYQMLVSEKAVTRYQFGKPYKVFELPSGARNEALDIRVYNLAAAVSLNPAWEALMRNQKPKPEPEAKEVKAVSTEELQNQLTDEPVSTKSRRRMPRRRASGGSSFVNNY